MRFDTDWLLGRVFVVPEWTDVRTRKHHLVTVTSVGKMEKDPYGRVTRDMGVLRGYVHTDGQYQTYPVKDFRQHLLDGVIWESETGTPMGRWRPGMRAR